MPPAASLKTFKYRMLRNETNQEQNRSLNATWLLIFCLISSLSLHLIWKQWTRSIVRHLVPREASFVCGLEDSSKCCKMIGTWEASGHSNKAKRQWTWRDPKGCGEIVLVDITWGDAHTEGAWRSGWNGIIVREVWTKFPVKKTHLLQHRVIGTWMMEERLECYRLRA